MLLGERQEVPLLQGVIMLLPVAYLVLCIMLRQFMVLRLQPFQIYLESMPAISVAAHTLTEL